MAVKSGPFGTADFFSNESNIKIPFYAERLRLGGWILSPLVTSRPVRILAVFSSTEITTVPKNGDGCSFSVSSLIRARSCHSGGG